LTPNSFLAPRFESDFRSVGKLGEQEQPIPSMVSAKATRSESKGQHSVTKSFQFGSNSEPRPGSIGANDRRIFSDHNSRAKCINNADELTAKRRLQGVIGLPCVAIFLAWVATADNVNALGVGLRPCSHVGPAPNVGPMLGEDSGCIVVDLHLPLTDHSSTLETKIKPANTRE
jgi:hypothetical protein